MFPEVQKNGCECKETYVVFLKFKKIFLENLKKFRKSRESSVLSNGFGLGVGNFYFCTTNKAAINAIAILQFTAKTPGEMYCTPFKKYLNNLISF